MSGICGILSLDGRPLPGDSVQRMLDALAGLGPDGHGTWSENTIAMGQQVTWLVPESRQERLPARHPESGIVLTLDGRLDNREDLLALLACRPDVSDATLIRMAYEVWGLDFASRLIGEFAFALWDPRLHRLLCVTDSMGVRPLYFTQVGQSYFAFASEVNALIALGDQPAKLNLRRLALLGVSGLTVLLEPQATCFEGIFRAATAAVTVVTEAASSVLTYWQPDHRERLRFRSEIECVEAFREVFSAAVRSRLRGTGPAASLLSGGLDSSAIVGFASHLKADSGQDLITLSAVPEAEGGNSARGERHFMELFREREHVDMRFISAPGRGPFDRLADLVASGSLCSYSYQHFLYTALAEEARANGIRVVLDGHGGELSASATPRGYLAELARTGRWPTLVREMRKIPGHGGRRTRALRQHVLRPLVPRNLLKAVNRQARFGQLFEYPLRQSFIQDVLGNDRHAIVEQVHALNVEFPDHRRCMVNEIQHEQNDLRQRSHAGFLGYRQLRFSYPYLDRRVIDFALAVDGTFKFAGGQGRRLLRLAADGLVPDAIVSRADKSPFCPDYPARFAASRCAAQEQMRQFAGDVQLRDVVDFERIFTALNQPAATPSSHPMAVDYASQFLVPNAAYLCYFLKHFEF